MILKTTTSFIILLGLSIAANAEGLRCEDLFQAQNPRQIEIDIEGLAKPTNLEAVIEKEVAKQEQQEKIASRETGFDFSDLKGDVLRYAVESSIRDFAQNEMLKMSADELAELRAEVHKIAEAHKIGKKLFGVETRNSLYRAATGSVRPRVVTEEANNMRRVRNELKRGSIDQAVESMEADFVQFEVNFLYMQSLRGELDRLLRERQENTDYFNTRLKQLVIAEKKFGKNFYKYQAMQNMLEEVKKSIVGKQKTYARKALQTLQEKALIDAAKQFLIYRKITLEEVERYADFSSVAKDAMWQRMAVVEVWTFAKMAAFSAPIVKMAKSIVYKLPVRMSLNRFGMDAEIQPRQALSEAIGLGHNQHLRDMYVDKIESVVALTETFEQYDTLSSLNAVSGKKDELLETFARVPENQKIWLEIKTYVKSLKEQNPENTLIEDFYRRMIKAEKSAIAQGPLSLYYNEAGVSVAGKLASGGITLWLFQKYIETPEVIQSLMHVLQ